MKKLFCNRCGKQAPETDGQLCIFDLEIQKRLEASNGHAPPTFRRAGENSFTSELCEQCVEVIVDVIKNKVPA